MLHKNNAPSQNYSERKRSRSPFFGFPFFILFFIFLSPLFFTSSAFAIVVQQGESFHLTPFVVNDVLNNNGRVVLPSVSQVPPAPYIVTGAYSQGAAATLTTHITNRTHYGQLTSNAGGGIVSGNIALQLNNSGVFVNNGDLFNILNNVNVTAAPPTLQQPTSSVLSFVRDTTTLPAIPNTTYRLRAIRELYQNVNQFSGNDGLAQAFDTLRTSAVNSPNGLNSLHPGLLTALSALDAAPTPEQLQNYMSQFLPADANGGAVYSSMHFQSLLLDKISLRLEGLRYRSDPYLLGYAAGDGYTYMLGNQATYGPIFFGNFAKQQENNGFAGYTYGTGGIGITADTPVEYFGRLGLGISYAQTSVKTENNTANRITAGSFQMFAYGAWDYHWLFLDSMAYYGLNNYRSTRHILVTNQEASGKFAGLQYGGKLRGGFAVPIFTINIVPFLELEYTHLTLRQYTETGAPGVNLTVAGREIDAAQGNIGVKLIEISEPDLFLPELHVIYLNTFKNPSLIQNAAFYPGGPAFTVFGPPRAKNGIMFGGSITAKLTNGSVLKVGYDYEARNRYNCQSAYINIRVLLLGGYNCCY